MKKSTLIKMGAGALVGAAIGFGIDMVVKHRKQKQVKEVKTNEEIVKENVKKMSDAVDLVVKTTCVVCATCAVIKVSASVLDYISEVDTKATVSNMLTFINGAKLGIIDKDTVKFALENALPTLDECSQRMLKEYANVALPELLGGE